MLVCHGRGLKLWSGVQKAWDFDSSPVDPQQRRLMQHKEGRGECQEHGFHARAQTLLGTGQALVLKFELPHYDREGTSPLAVPRGPARRESQQLFVGHIPKQNKAGSTHQW